MAKHNIKEAARLAGVDRATLYRAMAEGRITFETLPNKRRVIDTAELVRVFGALRQLAEGDTSDMPHQPQKPHAATVDLSRENSALLQQIETLRQHVAAAEADKTDLRRRLDSSEDERRRLLGLAEQQQQQIKSLTDQRQQPEQRERSWWQRWLGRQ